MKSLKTILSLVLLIQILISTGRAGHVPFASRCPQPSSIAPAECEVGRLSYRLSLAIRRPGSPSQELFDRLFAQAREANSVSSDGLLDCHNLSLNEAHLESWNLTSMHHSSYVFIDVNSSLALSSISDGPRDSLTHQPAPTISIEYLYLKSLFQFKDEAVSQLLQYVDPSALIMLQVINGALENFPTNESLAQLQKCGKLATLDLSGNSRMTRIRARQFEGLLNLQSLILKGNRVTVDELGLYLGQSPSNDSKPIKIDLEYCDLTSEDIHQNHGLDLTPNRPVTLRLVHNNVDTLEESKWKKFLQANDNNRLEVEGNPLVCGQGTHWLKDGSQEFEPKVIGASCSNDPGKTVFTSDL